MGVKVAPGKIHTEEEPYVVTAKAGLLSRSLPDVNDRANKNEQTKIDNALVQGTEKNRVHALGIIKLGLDAEQHGKVPFASGLDFLHCEIHSQANFLRENKSSPTHQPTPHPISSPNPHCCQIPVLYA